MLRGTKIYLRAVEPADATKLLLWENDVTHWRVSDTEVPYSMHDIMQYVESAHNIRANGQVRFIICKTENDEAVGAIDLFEANFKHGRAGVGILIGHQSERSKGFASESLRIIAAYAQEVLGFHNLYCSIHADNFESIHLFQHNGYEQVGVRKEWFLEKGKRIDELIYQLCLKK